MINKWKILNHYYNINPSGSKFLKKNKTTLSRYPLKDVYGKVKGDIKKYGQYVFLIIIKWDKDKNMDVFYNKI